MPGGTGPSPGKGRPAVDGKSFATGTDVLELDDQGRIAAISSFLDRAPEGFAHADH
jgi:hypothetical protein